MLIAIDGTVKLRIQRYLRPMKASFITQLATRTRAYAAMPVCYLDGPSIFSMGPAQAVYGFTFSQVRDLARLAVRFVRQNRRQAGKVILAGYSRGAAACIEAARMLRTEAPECRIDCLALFDAVERDPRSHCDVIPGNVRVAYHALRSEAVGSRWYFSNCGRKHEFPGRYVEKVFRATHASLGGLPWTGDHPMEPEPDFDGPRDWPSPRAPLIVMRPTITEHEDHAASHDVRQWMWSNLRPFLPCL
jgi:pimeloyl-ACP methyl ester carboxylesterase